MEVADELYDLRPEHFVEGRSALAKRLRGEGRKDEAADVAKLRRPSAVAWALNQVARHSPDIVAAAIEAGADLRAATDEAVAGDPARLRAATAAERAAANAVVKAAAGHLGGRSDALAPAILATIRVAALDESVADDLRRGVLTTEQEQPGFGFGADLEAVVLAPAPKGKAKATKATKTAKATKGRAVEVDEQAVQRKKEERAAAREAERARKKELAARQRTADRKRREAARLAKEADEAEAAARDARAVADAAAEASAAAEQALQDL